MRRALVLAGALCAAFLTIAPALAVGTEREVERELAFALKAEGFTARVFVSNNDGETSALMFLSRGPRVAYYSVPATVTADRVTAQFGTLGELDYRFAPRYDGRVDCGGAEAGEAVFDGSFNFTGEHGYVHIEASHAEGTFQIYPEPRGCPRGRFLRRVVPYSPTYSEKGATLGAKGLSRVGGTVREIMVFDGGQAGSHRIALYAFLVERREGMSVARGVQQSARSSAFHWNLEEGTATLRPPAPFTGWATFTRFGHKGHGTWRGSLGMPILGGKPVRLAGRQFRAFIHRGVPQDR